MIIAKIFGWQDSHPPTSTLKETLSEALDDLKQCPDDNNFVTVHLSEPHAFQVTHLDGKNWGLLIPTISLGPLFDAEMLEGLKMESVSDGTVLFPVPHRSTAEVADLCRDMVLVHNPEGVDAPPEIEVYCASHDTQAATKADVLSIAGEVLAKEAEVLALEGPHSGFAATRELDYPEMNSGTRQRFELYVMHIAAFVQATLEYGADGVSIQATMISYARRRAAKLLSGTDPSEAAPLDTVEKMFDDRVTELMDFVPRPDSMPDSLTFGRLMAARVFGGVERNDPIAAALFVRLFWAARDACGGMVENMPAFKPRRGS